MFKRSTMLSAPMRFITASAAGIVAPMIVLTAVALCFGNLPTLAALLGMIPLSAMLAVLAVFPWFVLQREALPTRWFVSLLIPVGLALEASAFLMWINNGSGRFDGFFVVANGVWAMVVALTACGLTHRLSTLAHRMNGTSDN